MAPDRSPIFLDTSVLMFAAGTEHPLREPCRRALRYAVRERIPLVTDAEVLQEILHRYFSLGRAKDAEAVYRSACAVCEEVIPITEEAIARALELSLDRARMSPRDALHVAVMERRDIRRILTTDRDFDEVKAVRRVGPAAFVRG